MSSVNFKNKKFDFRGLVVVDGMPIEINSLQNAITV
jgi:hypothetical protein